MIQYVVGALFSFDGTKVVLIEKQKPAWQAGKWNFPGGKIEQGEAPVQAMVRECEEEIGLVTTEQEWEQAITMNFKDCILHVFKAFDAQSLQNVRTVEKEQVAVFTIDELPTVIPNLHWLIPFLLIESDYEPVTIEYSK